MNRYGGGFENESIFANRDCDRGSRCDRRVENQEWGDDRHQHRDA